jgi:hypothetical protein
MSLYSNLNALNAQMLFLKLPSSARDVRIYAVKNAKITVRPKYPALALKIIFHQF